MHQTVRFSCPYCLKTGCDELFVYFVPKKVLVTCNLEEGGCDRDFVIEYKFEFKLVKTLKIDDGVKPPDEPKCCEQAENEIEVDLDNDICGSCGEHTTGLKCEVCGEMISYSVCCG
jgi:hypothetical protein